MRQRKIVLTTDVKRKGPAVIKSWIENPELDGYGVWNILMPFWANGIEVEVLSPEDYLDEDPTKYLFALVASKNFNTFPRWKGKLVAYVHDFHSVTNFNLQGYNAILAAAPKLTKRFSLESGCDLGDLPILWHPNVIHSKIIGRIGQRPLWTRKNFLVTGALHPHYYPDRYRLHQSIKRSFKKLKHGVRCSHLIGSSLIYNRRLAKKYHGQMWFNFLASYKTAIFAKDRWGYFVKKYTEIPLCGCLMVASPTEATSEAGLTTGKNYIALDIDRFWNIIEWIRSNPTQVEKIRIEGISWAHRFTRHVRYELIRQNIDIILSN